MRGAGQLKMRFSEQIAHRSYLLFSILWGGRNPFLCLRAIIWFIKTGNLAEVMRGNGCNISILTHRLVQPAKKGDREINHTQVSTYRFWFQYFIINWIFLLCLKRDELFQVITTEVDISHIAENKIGPNLHKTLSSHKSQLQLITSLLAAVATTSGYSPDNVKTVSRSPTWKEIRQRSNGCVSFKAVKTLALLEKGVLKQTFWS